MSPAPSTVPASQQRPFGGRAAYAILILAMLFVLMPFLFWRSTWFGRPLTDAQVDKALADSQNPREIQHALSLIADRILRGDPTVKRWYPQVVALAESSVDEIRLTVAWVMGQDNRASEFHQSLLRLLADTQPLVQRNAALSLVRFEDASGRAAIAAMLRPYILPAPLPGTLRPRLKRGDIVNPGTLAGHIEAGGQSREVRATVPGTLERWLADDGAVVSAGQGILLLAPSQEMVWEALRALYLIGQPEDLLEVDQYARGVEGMPPQIAQQAVLTASAIRRRSASQSFSPTK